MTSIFVDIHVLQTVPPSCVNRDETGAPKTAVYGGVTRARVSSQAWKKAMRDLFKCKFAPDEIGVRTKRAVEMIKEEILALESDISDTEAEKLAKKVLNYAGVETSTEKEKGGTEKEHIVTPALMIVGRKQAAAVAKIAVNNKDSLLKGAKLSKKKGKDEQTGTLKDTIQNALKEQPPVDLVLFGRMVAKPQTLSFDAASQVAHAISTHAIQNEFDYLTAIDELKDSDSPGAGFMANVEFNSSTLYRYATVNVTELATHLAIPSKVAVEFIRAFICSMPTGKQNSFANRTLPASVYITIRTDQPISLVTAFEKPIPSSKEGYEEKSRKALAKKANQIYGMLGERPALEVTCGEELEGLASPSSLSAALGLIQHKLDEMLQPNGVL
ncbi:MAG: type I-E CRISPR-associated protein Cas7/Cse4/CasC [Allobaculum sp.]|uniref:type I-E CRISPR-associated protein Cas7/Cse4/CasC n=1 Tax=Allobaculum sp. TaxID=1872463 RepID=UPI00399A1F1E